MSRIGKKPIKIENGVEVVRDGYVIHVKGPLGGLCCEIDPKIKVEIDNGIIQLSPLGNQKEVRAKYGLYRALIANMMEGVTKGYKIQLELVGVGYRVQLDGNDLVFSLGYSHPVRIKPTTGITFATEGNTKLSVSGTDKQAVGEISAKIRRLRKTDPYKGKGVKYLGEIIPKKAGKSVK